MIIIKSSINLVNRILIEKIEHHNYVIGVTEAPYEYISKTKYIDVIINSKLNNYLSYIEKIPLNLYSIKPKIFLLMVFYPLNKILNFLSQSIPLTTSQWYTWKVNIEYATNADIELIHYIRCLAKCFKPKYRPEILIETGKQYLYHKITFLNVECPIYYMDKFYINIMQIINNVSLDDLIVFPINPLGIFKREVDNNIVNYFFIPNRYRLWKERSLSKIFKEVWISNLNEYCEILLGIIHDFNLREALIPIHNPVNNTYYILWYSHKTDKYIINELPCRVYSEVLKDEVLIKSGGKYLELNYYYKNLKIKQHCLIGDYGLSRCHMHISILMDNNLLYDSGSERSIINLSSFKVKKL